MTGDLQFAIIPSCQVRSDFGRRHYQIYWKHCLAERQSSMAGFGLSVLSKSSKNIGYALAGYVRKTYRAGVGRGDTGHRTQDTGHRTRDTGHGTRDTGHGTRDRVILPQSMAQNVGGCSPVGPLYLANNAA